MAVLSRVLAFMLIANLAQLCAADAFPPTWSVGDTWQVHVKKLEPNIEGRATTEKIYSEFNKTYKVAGIEQLNGRVAYKMEITFSNSKDKLVVMLDKERRYVINYKYEKESLPDEEGINDVAPQDSLVGNLPGSADTLLDFIVFPTPNTNENRVVLVPGTKQISGYSQKITFFPTHAEVVINFSSDPTLASTGTMTVQKWNVGEKWPEKSTELLIPGEDGAAQDELIIETLVK